MMKRNLICTTLVLCVILVSGIAFANHQLDEAKLLCDRGDFTRALDIFMQIHKQGGDPVVVKEARYYIGFCKIKLQDYWGGVSALEAFLGQYENANLGDNCRLIPDALYVLGRTYEQVNKPEMAVGVYNRCISKFPGSDFASRSRERLNVLGPVGPGPGPGPLPPHPPIPSDGRIIDEIIRMAKAASTYAQQDEILLSGLNRAVNGNDVYRLAQAAGTNAGKDEICLRGVHHCQNTEEIIRLAKITATYAQQDKVCLAGLPLVQNGMDALRLAEAAGTNGGKDELCLRGVQRCQNVEEVIRLAKATATYAQQDRVCLAGLPLLQCGRDAVRLAQAAGTNGGKDEICIRGVQRCLNVDEVIQLAKATATYAKQDEVCLAGVRLVRTFDEATQLANATSSHSAQQRVLDEARKILLGSPHYSVEVPAGMSLSVQGGKTQKSGKVKLEPKQKTVAGKKPAAKKAVVDPFDGHKIDTDKVTRVNGFLFAIETMQNVDERRKALKKEDLSIETVKEAISKYNKKSDFEKVHRNKR